ncbi:MAG: primosomal protein N' [Phycisphaerales bacterium]|nr:primosomal protein N' [Phycisphaerales bacterium]
MPERFVRVAVERAIGAEAGDGLTYAAGPESPSVGERVEVPLGRGDRRVAGIVVAAGGPELLAGLASSRVKPILRRTGAALPAPIVELARWIADYYIAPLGMVLAAMLPAAVKQGVGRRTVILLDRSQGDLDPEGLPKSARAAWDRLHLLPAGSLPAEPRALASLLGVASLRPVNLLLRAGLLREVEHDTVRVRDQGWASLSVEAAGTREPLALTGAQAGVAAGVSATLGSFAVHLLRGVTGSGKTEVYLRLIERVLARGETALVLVPEIALTPQTASRFTGRFRSQGVAVLHSGLTAAQRNKEWGRVASGEARVVVGARSAVFAPLARLGLIVVDEEHDSSGYKQDQVPRYHGRDVAIKRGQIESCPVLLASATPSLESWANATRPAGPGRFHLWELTDRVAGGALPRVELVDMVEERRRSPSGDRTSGLVGPTLAAALAETLRSGGQAILLLNRRGYSTYLCCPDKQCGWILHCNDCDAAMVVHRGPRLPAGALVRCHHCLAEQLVPTACPQCGRPPVEFGTGTQQAEEEILSRFGAGLGLVRGESLVRVDSDTTSTGRDWHTLLARFAAGQIKVLLGTQMIAKGLDYPNVRLVGVLNADTALTIPDFRAAERTHQLISQVSGRAGRGPAGGRVIVQTVNPREPAIALAAAHDYVAFARRELAVRRAAGLPPVTRMARIVIRDESLDAVTRRGASLTAAVRAAGAEEGVRLTIMGPMPCTIPRIAGHHRVGIEILAATARDLNRPLHRLRIAGLLTSDEHTAVDVDPASLM